MTDIEYTAFVEVAIRYVDERYGRAVAWLVAAALVCFPVALLFTIGWWWMS